VSQPSARMKSSMSAICIAPSCHLIIPPDPISEVQHVAAVRGTTMLASRFGTIQLDEGDSSRQLIG
jgi:hypothetical protein